MRIGIVVALVVAVLDQITKAWVLAFFAGRPPIDDLTGFFSLVLVQNRGISFGFFNTNGGANTVVFTLIAAVIVGALLVWMNRVSETLMRIAIGLVIGGAIGNVIDRLARGAVVDFLDFHLGDRHWPAFNLADAAICIGVGLMVIDSLLGRREARN